MTIYTVGATFSRYKWWAEVEQIPGCRIGARFLFALDERVRETIALALDLPAEAEADLTLDWQVETGDEDLDRRAAQLRVKRIRATREMREVILETSALAATLRDLDWSVRDAAFMIGVSPQRVSQLAQEAAKVSENSGIGPSEIG